MDGVLLTGDAAGFLDPFTGEGIYAALRSAEVTAEVGALAVKAGDVSAAALQSSHARRATEFAAKTRLTVILQRVIARRALSVAVTRLLAAGRATWRVSWASSATSCRPGRSSDRGFSPPSSAPRFRLVRSPEIR